MSVRLAAVIVFACLCATAVRADAPNLSRAAARAAAGHGQRRRRRAAQPRKPTMHRGSTHVLRASDGSHYVAFSVAPPPSTAAAVRPGRAVRAARDRTRRSRHSAAERSPIREWLAGNQRGAAADVCQPRHRDRRNADHGRRPAAWPARREPPMNAQTADLAADGSGAAPARERQEDARTPTPRRARGQGRRHIATPLPFEDFDLARQRARRARHPARADGGPRRLFPLPGVGRSGGTEPPTVRVIKKRLTLPAGHARRSSRSAASSSRTASRSATAAYTPAEQASHPYSIGLTEIVPARDAMLHRRREPVGRVPGDQRAAHRTAASRMSTSRSRWCASSMASEQPVAALTPQNYSDKNLPGGLRFAPRPSAVRHGERAAGDAQARSVSAEDPRQRPRRRPHRNADADFTVDRPPRCRCSREAPPLGAAVPARIDPRSADALPAILAALRPAAPSPALQRAFDLAGAGRFVELMVEEPVPAAEEACARR